MPTRNINLTDHLNKFVDQQIRRGRYRNASEVLRAGLNLLEQRAREDEKKLVVLRRLAKEGFDEVDQGKGIEIDSPEELSRLIAGLGRKKSKRGKRAG